MASFNEIGPEQTSCGNRAYGGFLTVLKAYVSMNSKFRDVTSLWRSTSLVSEIELGSRRIYRMFRECLRANYACEDLWIMARSVERVCITCFTNRSIGKSYALSQGNAPCPMQIPLKLIDSDSLEA